MGIILPIVIAIGIGVSAAEYKHRKSEVSSRTNSDERRERALPPRENPRAQRGRKSKRARSKR